jgi:hypothetical protein
MKKGVLLLIGVFLVSYLAGADIEAVTGVAWFGDNSIYEYSQKTVSIILTQTNLINYSIASQGASLINPVNHPCTVNSNRISCASPWDLLTLDITAGAVSSDETKTWAVTTLDSSGEKVWNLNLEVLNDDQAPRILAPTPKSFSIVKSEPFTITVPYAESESGFNSGKLYYRDNSVYVPTMGSVKGFLAEVCASQTCTYTFDPSDGSMDLATGFFYFDSRFNFSDKAGNYNYTEFYHLYIDNQVPIVTPSNPAEDIVTSSNSQDLSFDMGDNSFDINNNFQPKVNCSVYVDGLYKNSEVNNANASITLAASLIGLADGSHSWYAECIDSAGWTTTTRARNFFLDTDGPVISLEDPNDGDVINNTRTVTINIEDSPAGINKVWYTNSAGNNVTLGGSSSYSISTAAWTGAYTLRVYADDAVGNINSAEFTFTVDVTGPSITLLSPADGSFGTGTFSFNATDDYSSTVSCSPIMNGSVMLAFLDLSGIEQYFDPAVGEGHHAWAVTCTDEVGNSATSTTWTTISDSVLPVVTLIGPEDGSFTNIPGFLNFSYTEIEHNPGSCNVYVDGQDANNVTLVDSNDGHVWYVSCTDGAGNVGKSSTRTIYYDTKFPTMIGTPTITPSQNGAGATLTPDEAVNITIFYGTNSSNLDSSKSSNSYSILPTIGLDGLNPSTLYYYKMRFCDQWGLCTDDIIRSFTTNAASSSPSVSSSGGGGSRTSGRVCGSGFTMVDGECVEEQQPAQCSPNWRCDSWSACDNGQQTRSCQDWSLCGVTDDKPDTTQACTKEVTEETVGTTEDFLDSSDDSTDSLGVGQATGIFNTITSNWKPIVGAIAIISLLSGLVGWKRESIGAGWARVRTARRTKKEDSIQDKLRKEGLIK